MSSQNPQGDYDQALALKDAGNAAFKAGDLPGALKNYSRIFMHIGMNPCMNMSQMVGAGGTPPDPKKSQSKDPLQQKTDALRLTAFNNMAAVYVKMQKWEDCKEKCTRVLKHDENNTKALFRRGLAHRKVNLFELARADLEKAKKILGDKIDPAIERELKLLSRDEKNADKLFYAKMKKQMQKAQKKRAAKKAEKEEQKRKTQEEEAKRDDNPNLTTNAPDDDQNFMWDIPQSQPDQADAEPRDSASDKTAKGAAAAQSDPAKPEASQAQQSAATGKESDKDKQTPSEF